MMRQLKRAYRVLIQRRFGGRAVSVDAVTEGAALELVERINKAGGDSAVYAGAVDAPQGAAAQAACNCRRKRA